MAAAVTSDDRCDAGQATRGAKDRAAEARALGGRVHPRQVRQHRGREPLEDEDRDPDEHRGREDEAGDLADVLAAAEHHEQRAAVDEHLVGDRDHGRRPGECDGGADVERRSLSPVDERTEHAAPDQHRQRDASDRGGDHRCRSEIARGDEEERHDDRDADGTVRDEQQCVAAEPAGAGEDAAHHVRDAVRGEAERRARR